MPNGAFDPGPLPLSLIPSHPHSPMTLTHSQRPRKLCQQGLGYWNLRSATFHLKMDSRWGREHEMGQRGRDWEGRSWSELPSLIFSACVCVCACVLQLFLELTQNRDSKGPRGYLYYISMIEYAGILSLGQGCVLNVNNTPQSSKQASALLGTALRAAASEAGSC